MRHHAGRQVTSGDKCETSLKSRGQRIETFVGDNWEKHPECTGIQLDTVGDKWRQVRDKPEIMRADHPECSERQLGDKCNIMQTNLFRSPVCSGRQA